MSENEKKSVYCDIDHRCVATIYMNRPEKHNAFDDQMIADFMDVLDKIEKNSEVRCVLLRGLGDSFSAGADLHWMKRMAEYTEAENHKDAMLLGDLLLKLYHLPVPVIAAVNGVALGGGVGLVACADIVVASEEAKFGLTEARLGLIPALISPYVIHAMGARACQRYFVTAETFSAERALRYELVHIMVPQQHLLDDCEREIERILKVGPKAAREAKRLVKSQSPIQMTVDQQIKLAKWIAELRVSDEAQEGMASFFEKRFPNWG